VRKSNSLKLLLLISLGFILSVLTVVLGTIPMRIVYKHWGRLVFWMIYMTFIGLLIVTGNFAPAAVLAAMTFLVGFYGEAELHHGAGVFGAGATAVFATGGLTAAGTAVWAHYANVNILAMAKEFAKMAAAKVLQVNANVEINSDVLAYQVPSFIVVAMILALAASLIWERRAEIWFRTPRPVQGRCLTDFRVPDALVWLAIAAGIGAFIDHGRPALETLSLNVLNVVAAVYFFQGMAVIGSAFRLYKVASFWQTLWFLILFLQLFPLVSCIGFTDIWIDYRSRLVRRVAATKKSFQD
jgi:hypothetical protein